MSNGLGAEKEHLCSLQYFYRRKTYNGVAHDLAEEQKKSVFPVLVEFSEAIILQAVPWPRYDWGASPSVVTSRQTDNQPVPGFSSQGRFDKDGA